MKPHPPSPVDKIIEAAIAAGTHSRVSVRYCDDCGLPTDSIWYVTIDKKSLCPRCADKLGQGPQALIQRRSAFLAHLAAAVEQWERQPQHAKGGGS